MRYQWLPFFYLRSHLIHLFFWLLLILSHSKISMINKTRVAYIFNIRSEQFLQRPRELPPFFTIYSSTFILPILLALQFIAFTNVLPINPWLQLNFSWSFFGCVSVAVNCHQCYDRILKYHLSHQKLHQIILRSTWKYSSVHIPHSHLFEIHRSMLFELCC